MNPLAPDEMLWQDRYHLDAGLLPKFIDEEVATKILTIGKAINFLRRLCGDSEWIMGPMAKVSLTCPGNGSSRCSARPLTFAANSALVRLFQVALLL